MLVFRCRRIYAVCEIPSMRKTLAFILLLLPTLSGVAQTPADRLAAMQTGPEEAAEIAAQASHANPRMRFLLLRSRVQAESAAWSAFKQDLDNFGQAQYERLKPLILEASIASLQKAVATHQLSYTQLTRFYLYRIRALEGDHGHYLNALISLNPDAIAEARQKDAQLAAGQVRPDEDSVFGMPILLKDNIGMAGLPTTAGAVALQENNTADAFITQRLKANGAIILGKTNLSEWAYFFCTGCPLGYSALGGQTLNPYGRKIIESGGSSSGSAVAVAANYAVAAVGTETSGSILSPSSLNSVVGLKPTTGLLSRSGIVPISATLDTPGPIARSVGDAVILLNAMSGYDQADTAMPLLSADVKLLAGSGSLVGKRLGIFPRLQDNLYYAGLVERLRSAGAVIIPLPEVNLQLEDFTRFLGAEMKRDLATYLQQVADPQVMMTSVAAVREFNLRSPEVRAPYGQQLFDAMVAEDVSPAEFQTLYGNLHATALQVLEQPLRELQLDALVSMNNNHAGFAAVANYPALTVPAGLRDDGEPYGITFIAPGFSEQLLVELALGFEVLGAGRALPENYQ